MRRVFRNEVLLERWREVASPVDITLWQSQLHGRVVFVLWEADLVNFHLIGLPVVGIFVKDCQVCLVPGQCERTCTYGLVGEILGRVTNRGKDVFRNDVHMPGNRYQYRRIGLLERHHDSALERRPAGRSSARGGTRGGRSAARAAGARPSLAAT